MMDGHGGTRWTTVLSVLSVLLLAGCAIKNEGATNYGKHRGTGSSTTTNLALVKKYNLPGDGQTSGAIEKNKKLSISLVQGFIKDFPEMSMLGTKKGKSTKRGEIAVVVKAFEMTSNGMLTFDSDSLNTGRVVYYNDDVRPNQYLNFSYLPVYGPANWSGNPIVLQIYVIEIDTANAQLKPLLGALSSLGAMIYPPAAPALAVLEKLGTALLNGSQDDILFRYHMTLYPESITAKDLGYPLLERGNYVLMRQEDRTTDFDWARVAYDKDEGRLVGGSAGSPSFRDETYFVFQVQDGFDLTIDQTQTPQYKQFLAKIRDDAASSSQTLVTETMQAVGDMTSEKVYNELKAQAERLRARTDTDSSRRTFLATRFVTRLASEIEEKGKCDAKKRYGCLSQTQIDALITLVQDMTGNATITSATFMKQRQDIIANIAK